MPGSRMVRPSLSTIPNDLSMSVVDAGTQNRCHCCGTSPPSRSHCRRSRPERSVPAKVKATEHPSLRGPLARWSEPTLFGGGYSWNRSDITSVALSQA
jgi:hypothetical protein